MVNAIAIVTVLVDTNSVAYKVVKYASEASFSSELQLEIAYIPIRTKQSFKMHPVR